MKVALILGTIAASVSLVSVNKGFAAGGDDILIGGQTTYDGIQYDPKANLLTVAGGREDDRIEVALADDGSVTVNGVSLAGLGIRVEGVPVVAIYGGGGNDILVARRLPLAIMNGDEGSDVLVWDNGDREFESVAFGKDVLLFNASETTFAFGGAGLDILIGNTGGDRDAIFGGLGQDDIVGGNTRQSSEDGIIGGWGNDWISGGTGRDGL